MLLNFKGIDYKTQWVSNILLVNPRSSQGIENMQVEYPDIAETIKDQ